MHYIHFRTDNLVKKDLLLLVLCIFPLGAVMDKAPSFCTALESLFIAYYVIGTKVCPVVVVTGTVAIFMLPPV